MTKIVLCPRCKSQLETDFDDNIAFCVDCDCTFAIDTEEENE